MCDNCTDFVNLLESCKYPSVLTIQPLLYNISLGKIRQVLFGSLYLLVNNRSKMAYILLLENITRYIRDQHYVTVLCDISITFLFIVADRIVSSNEDITDEEEEESHDDGDVKDLDKYYKPSKVLLKEEVERLFNFIHSWFQRYRC